MSTLLIIVAIIAAVILLFRHAAPRKRPYFSASERLPEKAILLRLENLGKRSAVTVRGFGLSSKKVDIKRIISEIYAKLVGGRELDDWETELYISRKIIFDAFNKSKNAIKKSYMLGHVNDHPRLFLLCNEIVKYTQGNITAEFIEKAVKAFEKYAPLDDLEKSFLPDMLMFCLCGLLYSVAFESKKSAQYYDKGVNDGKNGKVDLDYIVYGDYVCGLCDFAPVADCAAIQRLLECNGISQKDAELSRRIRLSKTYALIEYAVKSIEFIDSKRAEQIENFKAVSDKTPPRLVVTFFNFAPLVLIGIAAVLFCIFPPPRYAALFVVVSILIYAIFRYFMLKKYPRYYCVVLSNLFAAIKSKLPQRKQSVEIEPIRKKTEIAYFGGEPSYKSNRTESGHVSVTADNRGCVIVESPDLLLSSALKLLCRADGKEISLAACDGAFERHKSIYRAAIEDMEIAAEIIAPEECDACCRVTVINRNQSPKTVELAAIYAPMTETTVGMSNGINGGVAIEDSNGMVALAFDRSATYGGDLNAFTDSNELVLGKSKAPVAIGVSKMTIVGFSRSIAQIVALHGKSKRELERAIEQVTSAGYFDYADACARVFCGLKPHEFHESQSAMPALAERKRSRAPYKAHSLPKIKCDIVLPCGELTENGVFTVDPSCCGTSKKYRNILSDGDVQVSLSHDGYIDIRSSKCKYGIIDKPDVFSNMPKVFTAIGEDGIMWSPTLKPLGKGELQTTHTYTHTEYKSAYNGCITSLKVYIARKSNLVVFDLEIENTENKSRSLDAMFSALACRDSTVHFNGNNVYADCGEKSFAVFSTQKIKSFTPYKEGYFVRGEIDRCGNFRAGGSTPAPTVSVGIKLPPNGKSRAAFCVVMTDGKDIEKHAFDILTADAYIDTETEYFKRFWKIRLQSSDKHLNCMYKRSLYQAYACGVNNIDGNYSVKDTCVLLRAAKYVDYKSTKRNITKLLRTQFESGIFGPDNDDGIYVAALIADYVEHTRDYGFLDEYVPYKPKRVHGRLIEINGTVLEHCLRALDTAIYSMEEKSDLAHSICRDKVFIEALHYYAELCKNDINRREMYYDAIKNISSLCDSNVRQFKASNFFESADNESAIIYARALNIIGEYDKAFGILDNVNPINAAIRLGLKSYVNEPYMFCYNYKNGGNGRDEIIAALYYITVTEQLLGIKLRGSNVKISPCTAYQTPHVEFDIALNGGKAHIVVDDTEKQGDWGMRVDKIDYGIKSFGIDRHNGATVTFYRSGAVD